MEKSEVSIFVCSMGLLQIENLYYNWAIAIKRNWKINFEKKRWKDGRVYYWKVWSWGLGSVDCFIKSSSDNKGGWVVDKGYSLVI